MEMQYEKLDVSSTTTISPQGCSSSSIQPPPPYTNPNPNSLAPYPQNYPPGMPYYTQAPPPTGAPYYPQPGFAYPAQSFPNYQATPPQQQQQQQQVVVVGGQPQAPVLIAVTPYVSLTGAIVLSCVVFWCCGWLFGLIAFILAMVGQSSASSGDAQSAIQLRNASYGVSIAGIVVGIIIIAVVLGVTLSAAKTVNNCYYTYNGYKYYCK